MELTLITGMSGAGKSGAMGVYEDAGWFCVDNLPPRLLPSLIELFSADGASGDRIAVACDLRGGVWFDDLIRQLDHLTVTDSVHSQVIFLDADDDTLLNRFRETRRRHPLATGGSLLEAIERERTLLKEIRSRADILVDTTGLNVWDLRRAVDVHIADPELRPHLRTSFVSFGFKYGVLRDAELLFDVRFLPNPHYEPELSPLTGLDEAVSRFVFAAEQTGPFIDRLESLLDYLLPAYESEGRRHLVVGVGCTGGRHRSVALAQYFASRYAARGLDASASHRDIGRRS
jgi:RNase adapter protein RapZ